MSVRSVLGTGVVGLSRTRVGVDMEGAREGVCRVLEGSSTVSNSAEHSGLMIRGLYLENGNRDQNLVYKRQWGHCVLPRYTSSILGLCYAIQVSMERRRNGGGKGEGGERCV